MNSARKKNYETISLTNIDTKLFLKNQQTIPATYKTILTKFSLLQESKTVLMFEDQFI